MKVQASQIRIADHDAFVKKYPQFTRFSIDTRRIASFISLGGVLEGVSIADVSVEDQNKHAAQSVIHVPEIDNNAAEKLVEDAPVDGVKPLTEKEKEVEASMRVTFKNDGYKIPDNLRMMEGESVRDFSYRLTMEYRNRKQ